MSGKDEDLLMPITIGNQPLTDIDRFTYLGSVIAQDGDAEPDVTQRIGKAADVFQKMRNIWKSPSINTSLKIRLYMAIVLPMAIYARETWENTVCIGHKLDVFHQRCLRYILHVTYHDHVTNEEILRRAKTPRLSSIVSERHIKLAGHILRQPEPRLAKIALTWMPPNGRRRQGRPKKTWRRTFKEDLKRVGIKWEEVESHAANRYQWNLLAAQCAL